MLVVNDGSAAILLGPTCAVLSPILGDTGLTASRGGARLGGVRAARVVDGAAIPRGTEVVVLRHERGTALVERWDALIGDAGGAADGEVRNAGPPGAA
jgi:hypothetical protein